jgi:predicted Zn-dependent protease
LAIAQQLDSLDQCGEISSGEQLKTLIEAHRVVDPTLFDWSCARLSDVRESYRRALGAQLLEAVGGDPRGARLIGIWGQAESLRTQDAEAGLWLLEVAIHAAPSDPELLAACGQMLFDTGRLTEARWHLERAVAQQPTVDSLNRLRLIGELTNDQGLAQSSANHLKQLSAADPGIPPVRLLSPEAFLQSSARGEVAQLPQPWKDVSPSTFPSNRPRTRHR